MKKETLYRFLKRKGACQSARLFARGKTDLQAWRACRNPSWLLWAIGVAAKSDKELRREERLLFAVQPSMDIGDWSKALRIIRRHYPRPPKRPKE